MANILGKIIPIKDKKTGEVIFPPTVTNAVYDNEGNRLDNTLNSLNSTLDELIETTDNLITANGSGTYTPSKPLAEYKFITVGFQMGDNNPYGMISPICLPFSLFSKGTFRTTYNGTTNVITATYQSNGKVALTIDGSITKVLVCGTK